MLRTFWRFAVPLAAIAVLGLSPPAKAVTVDLTSGGFVSLADLLFADTNGPGGTDITSVQVGDKLFYGFGSYSSTALGVSGQALPVNSAFIAVSGLVVGADEGLRFSSAKWKAFANGTQDTHFDYNVTSTIGNLIEDITLRTTGSATIDGAWAVHETVLPSGQALNVLSTLPALQTLSAHSTFTPVAVAHVSKDIALDGGNNPPYPNAASSISDVDQLFSQTTLVPLPATANMGLALMGGLAGFGFIRRVMTGQVA